jgi:protein translocase SecG subunit
MFTFLLVVHAIIAAALVTVILMQRSEGGGLGMGGGPAGLMTARGAADFLTRATAVLATLFVLMAFLMAVLAARRDSAGDIDTSLEHQAAPTAITAPVPAAPVNGIPMMGGTAPAAPDAATAQALAPAAAGLPTAAQKAPTAADLHAQAAAERANAKALHPAPTADRLKTIDTSKEASAKIGIGGVSTGSRTAPTPAATPAPAATKPVPTINIAPPAPAAGTGGNSPQ